MNTVTANSTQTAEGVTFINFTDQDITMFLSNEVTEVIPGWLYKAAGNLTPTLTVLGLKDRPVTVNGINTVLPQIRAIPQNLPAPQEGTFILCNKEIRDWARESGRATWDLLVPGTPIYGNFTPYTEYDYSSDNEREVTEEGAIEALKSVLSEAINEGEDLNGADPTRWGFELLGYASFE